MKLKRKINLTKEKKKYINKKIMIKNETKSKSKIFIERLNWKEKPFQQKGKKTIKTMRIKLKTIMYFKFLFKHWDWMMKLKTNQNFIKGPKQKLKIKRIKV